MRAPRKAATGFGLALVAVGLSAASTQQPRTLEDCYAGALKRSEVIGTQTELITQAEEHIRQAVGGVLPNVSGGVDYTWQQVPPNLTPTQQAFFISPTKTWKVMISQPIFRGFREFAGIRQTHDLQEAQVEAKKAAELQLFKDVAQSFYTVLTLEQDQRDVETELEYYSKRISDLRGWIRIGRSRESEALTVEAAAASLRAQQQALVGQVSVAREMLVFLTGFPQDVPLADNRPEVPPKVDTLDGYLARLEQRPDVKGNVKLVSSAEENKRIAWGAHLPSADILADLYPGGIFQRSGFNAGVSWDIALTVSIPIYSGGAIQSKVREASSQLRQAELADSQTRRQAEQEIRSDFESLQSDLQQLTSLADSARLNEKNYRAQDHDYRLGLVTNIDVLTALTSFQESQRALDRARFAAKLDDTKLEAAAGNVPASSAQ